VKRAECILPAVVALNTGTRLGSFEILSLIGAGGISEVYRARDTRLGRTVALKTLRPDKLSRPERFHLEARVVSRLSHPHICSVYDVGEENGTAFLVMEYLEGQTLASRLDDGAIPLAQALKYGVEICEALAEAHRHGIVHRDVKPGNVMLTRDGVKLLDFGLAKLREAEAADRPDETLETLHLTDEGGVVGTVSYTSPEQLEGRRVDARTDLFAVGVVLYEMVTGRRPFAGESRAAVAASILMSDPPPIARLHSNASPALERLITRCLAKNPDDRWQTARDLAWELSSVAGEYVHGARVENKRRGRALLVGAIAGASLVAAGFWSLSIFRMTDGAQPTYERLTFRRGIISSARFAPDGRTVVFSATWDARPYDVFLAQVGRTESRSLGIADGRVLSVSPSGELAVLLGPQSFFQGLGTLARVSLTGGVPRQMLDRVTEADWGPDGTLAVVKRGKNGMELEFPLGTRLHEARSIWSMRVSPQGDRVAFFESDAPSVASLGELAVVDRSRRKVTLTNPLFALGLAWSPRGDEVWFSGARSDGAPAIRAVSLSGPERLVERGPAPLMIHDISRDGRALVLKGLNLGGITCLIPGETRERDLGWLDNAYVEGLSADGKSVLFGARESNWRNGTYVRATDGSPAVRLGDGHPESLSPDGKWVLARAPGAPNAWGREWVLLPTGAGSPRTLPRGAITQLRNGAWLRDGKRVVFTALEEDRAARVYVQDVESGSMRPITPEGVFMPEKAATPDDNSVLVLQQGRWLVYPLDGGESRPLSALGASDAPLQWSADGRFLYIASEQPSEGVVPSMSIERLDVHTGHREPWKTLVPFDPVGVERLDSVVISPDGRGYCYSYARRFQELYAVEGLK